MKRVSKDKDFGLIRPIALSVAIGALTSGLRDVSLQHLRLGDFGIPVRREPNLAQRALLVEDEV